MDSMTLGLLIIGTIGAITLIQLIVWVVVVLKDPHFDFLRFEPQGFGHPNAPLGQTQSGLRDPWLKSVSTSPPRADAR